MLACVAFASFVVEAQGPASEPPELKLSVAVSSALPLGATATRFAELANEAAARAFTVKVFPGATLAKREPLSELQALAEGAADFAVGSTLAWSAQVPSLAVYSLPWIAPTPEQLAAIVGDPALRSAMTAKLAEFGVIALAFAPLGHRDLATAKGPVISPGDVRGLRVRVLALPFLSELYVALGAAPRTLGFAEAQAAFAAGELDAQEASAPSLESARVVAIGQKDVIRWGGTGEALVIAVRRAVWEGWSEATREQIRSAAMRAAGESDASARDERALVALRRQGATVVRFKAPQFAEFRDAAKSVSERWSMAVGADLAATARAAADAAAPAK